MRKDRIGFAGGPPSATGLRARKRARRAASPRVGGVPAGVRKPSGCRRVSPGMKPRIELVLLGLLAGMVSCSDGAPASGTSVVEVSPRAGEVGVNARSVIQVHFRDAVSEDQLGQAPPAVFGRWSGVAKGNWALASDGMTARFTPSSGFMAGEWVTVTLASPQLARHNWGFWIETSPGTLQLNAGTTVPVRRSGEGRVRAYGAYAGDLDGDGHSDLVVPNEDTDDLRVFLNDGAGAYGAFEVVPIPNGQVPSTNEGADFNGDGLLDFAVGQSRGDRVAVFFGDGLGGLDFRANHTVGLGVRALCVADFDLDGHPDILTANREEGGSVSLLHNDGAGGFAAARTFDTGADGETACAVADVNADGAPDAWIGAIGSQEVVVLLGDGLGDLSVGGRFPAGGGPWMMASGDIDGDGHEDLLSANAEQDQLAVLRGDGAGGLGTPTLIDSGDFPLSVDVGDLDGDGDLDVVTSNFGTADFTVFENRSGSLARFGRLPASVAGSCVILHDRDNDGDLDLTGIDELDDLLFLYVNPG